MLTADIRGFSRQGQWSGAYRKPVGQRHGWLAIFALALAGFAFIEVALLFRSWTQLSAEGLNSWWKDFLYQAGGSLAQPFTRYETVPLSRTSDVLQYSVLVAAEAYFVIAAVALLAIAPLSTRRLTLWSQNSVMPWRACSALSSIAFSFVAQSNSVRSHGWVHGFAAAAASPIAAEPSPRRSPAWPRLQVQSSS